MRGRKLTPAHREKIAKGNRIAWQKSPDRKEVLSNRMRGSNNHAWKGGFFYNGDGYKMIRAKEHPRASNTGYVFEHIIVWETENAMPVPDGHIIHHLNGIRTDNRPENLVAMSRGEHLHQAEPYKERIRKLEEELAQLRELLDIKPVVS